MLKSSLNKKEISEEVLLFIPFWFKKAVQLATINSCKVLSFNQRLFIFLYINILKIFIVKKMIV